MSIIVRHVARVELPDDPAIRGLILGMYSYSNKYSGETFFNYTYKNGVCFLPPNMDKLKIVASILGEEIVDDRSSGSPLGEPFVLREEFKLRDYQVEPVKELAEHTLANNYSTLSANTGAGKTLAITRVYGELGCTVLTLVDQANLIPSWVEAAELVWNKPVQKLKAGDTEFSDICISTLQLLAKNSDLLTRIKKEFGTVVLDECHIAAAESYKRVLSSLDNKYRLACSASFMKKGFGSSVLEDYLAKVSVVMSNANALVPEIRWVDTGVIWPATDPNMYANKILPCLAGDAKRNSVVFALIKKCLEEKRITAIMAIDIKQAEFFNRLALALGARSVTYVGTTSAKQDKELFNLIESRQLDLVCTVSKILKGSNLPNLDTLILVKPNNSEIAAIQTVGRICRVVENKPTPIVYDLADVGNLAETFSRNRGKFYKKLGYTIIN